MTKTKSAPQAELTAAEEPAATDLDELRQEIATELPPAPPRPPAPPIASEDAETGGEEETLIETLEEMDASPEKLAMMTGEDWADIWELLFELCAALFGDHWELERDRALRLGKITKRVETRYGGIGGSIAKHIPLIVLVLLLGATIAKKAKVHRDLKNPPLRLHGAEAEAPAPSGEVTS